MQPGSTSFIQRLRAVFRVWSNIRRLPLVRGNIGTSRVSFAFLRGGRAMTLWVIYRLTTELTSSILRWLNVTIMHFAPANRGILPPMTRRDLYLRAVFSVRWIWSTYAVLTGTHDLLAIFFVCLLRWDQPDEWPALFGSLAEAYSLRRFWGAFWHRLHVAPFEAYFPLSFLRCDETHQPQRFAGRGPTGKALRALWMFLLSAGCHATINWVTMGNANATQEFRFFLSNYAVCFAETVAKQTVWGKLGSEGGILVRLCGYVWVIAVFFCLVPAWQYSLVCIAAGY
ncbi:Uncharacterized protein TPAR_08715 [Tolypocladium paradoxum]|uniref:Wax synthase domain-containing protein n=1 Tax=Tolypocladium paradoxum TaxID=94208 RepID=A0A2S4KLP1_9HYPO|nr:Uncharacterized protein TPAR_08715 [Tolypocladium paradoxum]